MLFGFDGAISFLGTSCSPKSAFEVNKKKTPKEKISMTFMGLRICCGYNTSDQKYNM